MRRRWIVITFLLTVLTTVTIGTFMIKPQYRSPSPSRSTKKTEYSHLQDVYAVERPEEDY